MDRALELQLLHGVRPFGEDGNERGDMGPGCKGLEEVIWVVDSNYCQVQSGDPSASECSPNLPAKRSQAEKILERNNFRIAKEHLNTEFKWLRNMTRPNF